MGDASMLSEKRKSMLASLYRRGLPLHRANRYVATKMHSHPGETQKAVISVFYEGEIMLAKTISFDQVTTQSGVQIEQNDLYRALRIDGGSVILCSEPEYRLFSLLLASSQQPQTYWSYEALVREVYGCDIDEALLMTLRKRISALRKKLVRHPLDIVCIINRGYQLQFHKPLFTTISSHSFRPRSRGDPWLSFR